MIVALDEAKRKLTALYAVVAELRNELRIDEAKERFAELERETMVQDFWNDAEKSSKKLQEIKQLKDKYESYEALVSRLDDTFTLCEMAIEAEDEDSVEEVLSETEEIEEAAEIDGANAWQKFRTVTLPGIAPTTFFLLQAGVAAGLLTYDLAALIIPNAWGVPGGNESMGLTLVRLVYYLITNSTTSDANGVSYMVSCACVISWLLFLVTGILSMIMFRQREKSLK